jgi:hypothetical protein
MKASDPDPQQYLSGFVDLVPHPEGRTAKKRGNARPKSKKLKCLF